MANHQQHIIGKSVEVRVDSLGGLGEGIATLHGKPLFVKKTCAGDVVRARITHVTQEAYTATLEEVLTAGEDRAPAPCPHYAACGGCSLQHLSEAAYREFKTRQCLNAVNRAGYTLEEMPMVFLPAASRRRVEFKTTHTGGQLQLAFYEPRSRHAVALSTCIVLEPQLQALMVPLQQALQNLPFGSDIRGVALTHASSGIDMLLHVQTMPDAAAITPLLAALGVQRISACTPESSVRVLASTGTVTMRFGDTDMPLPPHAFLQAAREGENTLVQAVLKHVPAEAKVLDLFAGLGTYSWPLAARQSVHAVEMEESMVRGLKKIARGNLTAEQRDLFKQPFTTAELARYDAVVINPPRAGASAQVRAIASSTVGRVVMVSCNVGSFARDAKILKEAGFRLTSAFGLDQFVFTPHVEICTSFEK